MEEQKTYPYPPDNIDPEDKDKDWGMKYLKAAWNDWNYAVPRTLFYNCADKYEELRLYAIGKQPVNKYKKLMGVDEQTNLTWLNIDWSVRPIVVKLLEIALARMIQQEYNIVCTPIDPEASSYLHQIYAKQKAKIAVRQLMQQQSPDLAQHPMLQAEPGEPMDSQELDMRLDFGEQFNRSKDAEQAIQLGFYENGIKEFRKRIFQSFLTCGVAGYEEHLGDDNRPKFTDVNVEAVVTNYCRFGDFRDLIHAGEVLDVALVDLAALRDPEGNSVFTEDQLQDMKNNIAGKWSNPTMVGRSTNYFKGFDKHKVKVLKMRFYSWNDYNWENNVNRKGNIQFNEAPWYRRNNIKNKYIRKRVKVVYQASWVIGTDYVYDFKLMNDMKRSVNAKRKAETDLGYRFYAPNFYEMRAIGMMERLMPLVDQYHVIIYRIQNVINRMVPNGWWIDLDGLENVAIGKGGENMKPMDLLNMFFETGVLVGRSKDLMGNNVNYKPVIPLSNNNLDDLQALYMHLQQTLTEMQSMIGLNDLTDASTPNPKTLNGVANMAQDATNNALFSMQNGEKWLMENLASDVLIRMQQGIKKGGIEGYAPALNNNALTFLKISPDITLSDYGIMLDEKPTDDQKQMLMQQMQQDIANGMLDTSDALYVMNVYNIKQAQQLLAFKVKRNKMAVSQEKMQQIQAQNQGNQQTAQMTAQMAQQSLQMEYQLKGQLMDMEKQWDYKIQQLKMGTQQAVATDTNQTKTLNTILDHGHKERLQQMEQSAQQAPN